MSYCSLILSYTHCREMECRTMPAYIFFAATFAMSPINVLSSRLLFARSSVISASRLTAFSSGVSGSPGLTISILFGSASWDVHRSYTPPAMNLAMAASCPKYISSSLVQSSNSCWDSECSGSCLGGWILMPGILTIYTSFDSMYSTPGLATRDSSGLLERSVHGMWAIHLRRHFPLVSDSEKLFNFRDIIAETGKYFVW